MFRRGTSTLNMTAPRKFMSALANGRSDRMPRRCLPSRVLDYGTNLYQKTMAQVSNFGIHHDE